MTAIPKNPVGVSWSEPYPFAESWGGIEAAIQEFEAALQDIADAWTVALSDAPDTVTLPRAFVDDLAMTLEWAADRVGAVNPTVLEKLTAKAAELRGVIDCGDDDDNQ